MKGHIIAFTGAHGTGKTTSVLELASQLKKTAWEEVGILTEVARDCPLPVLGKHSGDGYFDAQRWIFSMQMARDIEMSVKYGVTVSDRTVADAIAYSLFLGYVDLAIGQLDMASNHMGIYEKIYLKRVTPEYLVDDGFRDVCLANQAEVEMHLIEVYKALGVDVLEWSGEIKKA